MRVLFAVSSWTGHYFPMVPLGWALRAAGHDVRVLCCETDVAAVTQAGLTPVPVLDGIDILRGARLVNLLSAIQGRWPYPEPPLHPDTAEPVEVTTFDFATWQAGIQPELLERATRSTDAAVAYARSFRPDLVVHDMMSLEGPLVAKVTGVPDVMQLWGPVGTADEYGPVGSHPRGRAAAPEDTSSAFERYGVGEMGFHHVDHVLDPCPAAIRPRNEADLLPCRYIPYNGPGAVPLDLPGRTGRPRVCVVWGRSATRTFGPVVNKMPQAVEASASLGFEVLLLASPADVAGSGPLPEGVHVRENLPLSLVLPECDAVVHYGGGGVTMTSVVAGVPQLSLPCGYDQPAMAGRVTAAGAGLDIPNHEADLGGIKSALDRLLGEPSFTASARELAVAANALPAPSDVVGSLRGLVS
ncbi:DUF1205 domain-containing protein [Saccharopolyspora erythraea]|uniref:nucleotide disphospho-sugar-binding domain-containing protein n=1 Tax=Saccharopolyspora erythraea TaxID=1836 RepID=UPI001BAD23BB|nr:nucleotide disphospho-sugar-binding domain-containing protein [Saccharopolyspora erythraea]QUH01934.1 DUF1205 domain-containing protein [Saccharopolyspora erythraea]